MTNNANKFRTSDEARLRGIDFVMSPLHGQLRWMTVCSLRAVNAKIEDPFVPGGCQPYATIGGPGNLPPDVVEQKFLQKGWTRKGATWWCPHCSGKRPMAKTTDFHAEETTMAPDAKVMRRTLSAIEDVLNETTMRYAPGHSDETIAKKLELSPGFVHRVRKEAFGELSEDPVLSKLRADIEAHGLAIEKAESILLDRLGEILGPLGAAQKALHERITKIEIRGVVK